MPKLWPAVLAVSTMAAAAVPVRVAAQEAAQQGAGVVSVEVAVGTAVADRALSGASDSFAATVGKLYCFSRISNAINTDIEHVWYHRDAEVTRVRLTVGGSPWRTFSSKTIPEDATGEWRCDVVQGGDVLKSVAFRIE